MQADTLSAWLAAFSAMHDRAKQGALDAAERAEYLGACEELAEALMLAQHATPRPGQELRKSMRVAQALPVELTTGQGHFAAITLDISEGGFSTILPDAPEVGSRVQFRLKLGRGRDPVGGIGRVANAVPQNGSVRVGLRFEEVSQREREQLGYLIVDAVLRQFGRAA